MATERGPLLLLFPTPAFTGKPKFPFRRGQLDCKSLSEHRHGRFRGSIESRTISWRINPLRVMAQK